MPISFKDQRDKQEALTLLLKDLQPVLEIPFILPAILQKLVGEFFDFCEGNFAGNVAGILRDFSGPTR